MDVIRVFIAGGLNGYKRFLSLSKNTTNPRWKPLHLSASWNKNNRITAKMGAKKNWFKGKSELKTTTFQPTGRQT